MANVEDVADSTDWLSTPLAAIASLESSLRCQVCKDFFTTPMITSCSHTFCSLCIRRYLSQEGSCPACRKQDQEMKLRRNWVVEELVTNFTASRHGLLAFARDTAARSSADAQDSGRPKKRRKVEADNVNGQGRNTRSRSKKSTSQVDSQSMPSTQEEVMDSDEGSLYGEISVSNPQRSPAKEPRDGLVSCPCCGRRMKEILINSHLDSCIAGDSRTPVDESSFPIPNNPPLSGAIAYGQSKPPKQKDRLPFINYSLLNDNAMRKKLKELGIPNHGSKELMKKRHTEWVNLWNANCDSRDPETKIKLLKDLDIWERTLGRQTDRGPSGVMMKDFDRDDYARRQKGDFDDLIAKARQRRKAVLNSDEQPQPHPHSSDSKSPPLRENIQRDELEYRSWTEGQPGQPVETMVLEPTTVQSTHHISDSFADMAPSRNPPSDPELSQRSLNQDIAA